MNFFQSMPLYDYLVKFTCGENFSNNLQVNCQRAAIAYYFLKYKGRRFILIVTISTRLSPYILNEFQQNFTG